jgi:hypothetical protein
MDVLVLNQRQERVVTPTANVAVSLSTHVDDALTDEVSEIVFGTDLGRKVGD